MAISRWLFGLFTNGFLHLKAEPLCFDDVPFIYLQFIKTFFSFSPKLKWNCPYIYNNNYIIIYITQSSYERRALLLDITTRVVISFLPCVIKDIITRVVISFFSRAGFEPTRWNTFRLRVAGVNHYTSRAIEMKRLNFVYNLLHVNRLLRCMVATRNYVGLKIE